MAQVQQADASQHPAPDDDLDQARRPDADDTLFAAAMPKEEIGALAFLKDHKDSDGRGVIVAIFDTGVDPGSEGLQQTTNGKRKIIDVVDGTGSGDVDTSTVVEAKGDDTIDGLYKDVLELNSSWQNPTGKWHVGAKHLYDLVPKGLTDRLKKERRKLWDEQQAAAVTAAWKDFSEATKAVAEAKGPEAKHQAGKWEEECKNRTQLLKDLMDKYKDAGPLIQCVVWHDGTHWRAALDTKDMYPSNSGKGKLEDFEPLTDYRTELKYGTFSKEDGCNFVCNIYEEGNVLSIVVDAGSHGTHVAGITAAYSPDNPSRNGIAPGAQIISCKIGDTRVGGMETGTGLTRALITVLQHKADLINLSYGEATTTPNFGRFVDLVNEVVHKHGVIFVAAAGNAGPALTTVGAPGGTSSAIMSIGAYVSPAMAAAAHSVRQEMPEGQQYTWSSRGPTSDGDVGISLSAPGGAIAPVPQWTQQVRQLMNGTSMASPNACGGIALVLSAMKRHNMAISPNRVRRALENTCLPIREGSPDAAFTHGQGLLQVHKAFEYLSKSEEVDQPDVRYEVTVRRSDSQQGGLRGVMLREPLDTAKAATYMCEVHPKLHEDAEMDQKLQVYDEVTLECTCPWVQAPKALILPHNGRNFEVKVDPTSLDEGLHYGEVHAYDSKARWRGPLFRIPVTVMKPVTDSIAQASVNGETQEASAASAVGMSANPGSIYSISQPVEAGSEATNSGKLHEGGVGVGQDYIARLGHVSFKPGSERRFFLAVPEGATWGEMTLRAGPHDTPRNFMLRATQILPHTRYSDSEARAYASLSAHASHKMNFKLTAGAMLEITLSQFWSSLGAGELEAEVAFHGVEIRGTGVIPGPARTAKVHVRAPFRTEKVKPVAKLTTHQLAIRPTDHKLQPSNSPTRDQLPQGRTIHTLLLTYKFKAEVEGKYKVTVPILNRYVYDGEFEGQMSMLHAHPSKQLMQVSDIYPAQADLKKGDHVVRLQLRHDNAALLNKMSDIPVVIEMKLKEPVTLSVYANNRDAIKGEKAVDKERTLHPGERTTYFVGPVPKELPKEVAGQGTLTGSLQLGLLQGSKEHAPASLPLFFKCGPKGQSGDKEEDKAADEKEKPTLDKVVWEAKLKYLQGLTKAQPKPGSNEGNDHMYESLSQVITKLQLQTDTQPDDSAEQLHTDTQPDKSVKQPETDAQPDNVAQQQQAEQKAEEDKKSEAANQSAEAADLETELLAAPELGAAEKLKVLRAKLNRLNAHLMTEPKAVLEAADEAIEAMDQVALAQYEAQKSPEGGPQAVKRKKEMGEMKGGLTEALIKKCRALLTLQAHDLLADTFQRKQGESEEPESVEATGSEQTTASQQSQGTSDAQVAPEAQQAAAQDEQRDELRQAGQQKFEAAFQELRKWADPKDADYAMLLAQREQMAGRYATAIKALAQEGQAESKDAELRASLFGSLGWRHWQRHEEASIRVLCPKGYPLF